ncbi:MAG TPA: LysR family transcriptional regulator [Pseudolabrys sp.]|nr:LysR family transcriptional regulator [Pseudolabrys sp.]
MGSGPVKWDDLRVFLEVARQGSVHAAAKRLRLDHSTVCRRVGKLESILAVKLLNRTRKGVSVRADAHELLRHIENMDVHANALADAIVRGSADASRLVRVATMEGLASQYVAKRLSALAQFDASVRLELVSIPQTVDLSRKEADVFLSFFNPRTPGLTSKRTASVAMHLYAAPAYLRRRGKPQTLAELANHDFVGYIDELLAIDAVRWLDELVPHPRMVFHSNSILAQCNAAVGGLGIVMLPTFVAHGVAGLQRLFEDTSVQRDVWLSVRTEQGHLPRIKAVTRFLTHIFEHDRAFLLGQPALLDHAAE